MEKLSIFGKGSDGFAIICVLGAPGAGKGTICTFLAQKYNLMHYSVGDSLRSWMQENSSTQLARDIRDKLDNQGFLPGNVLNPFIGRAIADAIGQDRPASGILIDGYPRCVEQLRSFDAWPLNWELPLAVGNMNGSDTTIIPDIVLKLDIARENAEVRYLGRGRDGNDKQEKFDKRFAEYGRDTVPVEELYRQRDILIHDELDVNRERDETLKEAEEKVESSRLWQRVVVEGHGRYSISLQDAAK